MTGPLWRIALVSCLTFILSQAAPSQAQNNGADAPLAPGEEIVPMLNCGIAIKSAEITEQVRDTYRSLEWTGECRFGLIHGWGSMGKPQDLASLRQGGSSPLEFEAFFGRFLGVSRGSFLGGNGESYTADGKGANFSDMGAGYAPVWGQLMTPGERAPSSLQVSQSPNYRVVRTHKEECPYWDRDKWTPEQKRAYGACRDGARYWVYGVAENDQTGQNRVTFCPDPRTPAGCEALWREKLGALLVEAEAIKAAALAERDRRIAEVRPLVSQYEARVAAADRARREAAAQAAAEAQAEAARLDDEFRKGLTTKNAGQLFSLADELRAAGEDGKAREALRALVSRFPDHPLAVTAAQQMSQMGSASPGSMASSSAAPSYSTPARSSAPASPAGASAACGNAAAEEERLGQMAYDSAQKFPGETVRPMESLLWAIIEIQKLYRSCPSSQSAAKLQTYTQLYDDTMRTCSALASAPPCRARLH